MKKLLTTVAMVVIASSPAGVATAGTTEMPKPNLFEMMDIDQDGVISQQEAAEDQSLVNEFTTVDSDGDKKLTKEEYEQYLAQAVKKSG
ncbi:MAG: EF-hand domain-containing protein [Motiliproteus sp.]|nr:EF-hand domain-containing protein [Motiliproteus sp.]MCW9050736.1 EF-hand domain-containing protein [Motiliproteus sp.]